MSSAPLAPGTAFALALCASLSAGLTGFGDAVLYVVLWSAGEALALVPADALREAAALVAVVSLTQAPLLLVAARRELPRMLPYAVAMNLSAVPFSALGAWVLYHAAVDTLKRFVGVFFLLFSATRLTGTALAIARARRAAAAEAAAAVAVAAANAEAAAQAPLDGSADGAVAAAARVPPALQVPPAPAAPTGISDADSDITVVALPPASLSALRERAGQTLRWAEARLHPISHLAPQPYSVRASLLLMLCAGCLSGLLSGLMGVGGPPLMVAFSLLVVEKDDIRAISALFCLFELPTRIAVMWSQGQGSGGGFAAVDAALGACTSAGALIGFSTGGYLRRYVDSANILRVLLVIVLVASGVLLGALESAAVALAFAGGLAAWAAAIAALLTRPELEERITALIKGATESVVRQFAGKGGAKGNGGGSGGGGGGVPATKALAIVPPTWAS